MHVAYSRRGSWRRDRRTRCPGSCGLREGGLADARCPLNPIAVTKDWGDVTTALPLISGTTYNIQVQDGLVFLAETAEEPTVRGRVYGHRDIFAYEAVSGVNLWAKGSGLLVVDAG